MKNQTERIFAAIQTAGHIRAQNRLMAASDRDLAIVLDPMSEDERCVIYAKISRAKRRRVEEEVERQGHVNVTYAQYVRSADCVVAVLIGSGPAIATRSYLRPRRSTRPA